MASRTLPPKHRRSWDGAILPPQRQCAGDLWLAGVSGLLFVIVILIALGAVIWVLAKAHGAAHS